MKTEVVEIETIPDIDPDVQAVADAVANRKPVDAAVAKRIHERAVWIRNEIFRKHGLVDIAVPAVREFRGELPIQ